MGSVISLITGPKIAFEEDGEHGPAEKKDNRRRNSLAFNIVRFLTYEEDDFTPLVEEVKEHKLAHQSNLMQRATKYTKIGEAILRGNNREFRNQAIVNFRFINRKYKEYENNSVIHFLCQEGYPDMLEFLGDPTNHTEMDDVPLEVNPKNNKKRTPLFLCFTPPSATFNGQMFGVGEDGNPLCEKPEGIEIPSDWIKPGGPKAREQCIKILIKFGANVNEKDFHNFTALHYACIWGWASTVRILIQAGADINAMTSVGRTPLMYAVEYLNEGCVEALTFDKKLSVNAGDVEGVTALIIAMEKGNEALKIASILLTAGADPNSETNKKKSPMTIACKTQNIQQIHLLLDNKAKRRGSWFALLTGDAAKSVEDRMKAEDREAQELAAQEEARQKANKELTQATGYRNKSPWGAWVEYNDKRDGGVFYYNPVTRKSQKSKPPDFRPNPKRLVKDATFGMSFYH